MTYEFVIIFLLSLIFHFENIYFILESYSLNRKSQRPIFPTGITYTENSVLGLYLM